MSCKETFPDNAKTEQAAEKKHPESSPKKNVEAKDTKGERGRAKIRNHASASTSRNTSSSTRSRLSSLSSSSNISSLLSRVRAKASTAKRSSSSSSLATTTSSFYTASKKRRLSSSSSSSNSSASASARRSESPPKRKKRTPKPKPKKVYVSHLTKNVNKDHLKEIFGYFGEIRQVDLPAMRLHAYFSRGFAYIEFGTAESADSAVEHMNGAMIDGERVTVSAVLPFMHWQPPTMRQISPERRRQFHPGQPRGGRTRPWFRHQEWNRDGRPTHMFPIRRRSPVRGRSRSPVRRRSRSPVRRRSRSPVRRRSRYRSPIRRHPNKRSTSSSSC